MLTCVYHPIDDFRVVEQDEAERLMASGVWFDSPTKASEYRESVEKEIKQDEEANEQSSKQKEQSDERQ